MEEEFVLFPNKLLLEKDPKLLAGLDWENKLFPVLFCPNVLLAFWLPKEPKDVVPFCVIAELDRNILSVDGLDVPNPAELFCPKELAINC